LAHLSDQHQDHDHQLEAHCHPLSQWTVFVAAALVKQQDVHGILHEPEE
jgi:hypothetical protein